MHFYSQDGKLVGSAEGLPSPTTILDIRHKSALWDWKRQVGFDEAERISQEAAEVGTTVHAMIQTFLEDGEFDYDVDSPEGGYFKGFLSWYDKYQPTHLETEKFVISKKHGYAGRLDLACRINGEHYIVDWKTSNRTNPGMGLQLTAYAQAYYEMRRVRPKTCVVQLVPKLQRGYRVQEFTEPLEVFLAHKRIFDWAVETGELSLPWGGGIIKARHHVAS